MYKDMIQRNQTMIY